jgi:hypothetical protein
MTRLNIIVKDKKALPVLEKLRNKKFIDYTSNKKRGKDKIQTHIASEKTLAKDWLSKKEDEAWQDL